MINRYDQIELLLGLGHHSYTEGYHCEYLLKDYLKKNIPTKYHINTGFIKFNPTAQSAGSNEVLRASRQIDIIIHNIIDYAPLYQIDDLVIVLPESLYAAIEVKKALTSGNLKEALENVTSAKHMISSQRTYSPEKAFFAIYSFAEASFDSSSKTIDNRLKGIRKQYDFKMMPDFICCGNKYVIVKDECRNGNESYSIYATCFKKVNVSIQFFLDQLYQRLDLEESKATVKRFSFPNGVKPKILRKITIKKPRKKKGQKK